MKKFLSILLVLLLGVGLLAGCSKSYENPLDGQDNSKREYEAFALATSLTVVFDPYANFHSDNIAKFGEGLTSTNSTRFVSEENDKLVEAMRAANPTTDAGKATYQEKYREWVKLWNEELPLIPMYSNEYFDLYSKALSNFKTDTLYNWQQAILEASTSDSTNTVVVGLSKFNGEFIMGWGNSSYDKAVRDLVFDPLLTTNQTGEMVKSGLVDSFEASSDQKEWTFKLKEGLTFSDGSPLTTEDIAFTYYFYSDPSFVGSGGSGAYNPVTLEGYEDYVKSVEDGSPDTTKFTGVEIVSDTEIKFTVTDPKFSTWTNLFTLGILSKDYYQTADGKIDGNHVKNNLLEKPLGSGPYVFTNYESTLSVRLEKNEKYAGNFEGTKPTIDVIIAKYVDDAIDHQALLGNDIQVLPGVIEFEKYTAIKDAGLQSNSYPRHGYGHVSFHTDWSLGQYKEIRQAFAYSVDRDKFGNQMIGENATRVEGPYALTYWMIDEAWVDANLTKYEYDPAKAVEVMEKAGWERGSDKIFAKTIDGEEVKAEINIAVGAASWQNPLNLLLANSVEESGIKVNIHLIDFNVLLSHYYGSIQ